MVGRDAFFGLDELVNSTVSVARSGLDGDRLARERLDEDLKFPALVGNTAEVSGFRSEVDVEALGARRNDGRKKEVGLEGDIVPAAVRSAQLCTCLSETTSESHLSDISSSSER